MYWASKIAQQLSARDNTESEPWIRGDVTSPVWDDDAEEWVGPLLISAYNGQIVLDETMVVGPTSALHAGMTVDMVGDIFHGKNRQLLIIGNGIYRSSAAQDAIDAGKQDKLTAGDGITISDNVISATSSESDYTLLYSGEQDGTTVLSQVFDAQYRDILVLVTMLKNQVRVATNIYARQGTTYLGRINIAAGTVSVTTQTASLHCWKDHGIWHHTYLSPTYSGSTANYGSYVVYEGLDTAGGIDRVIASAALPAGAVVKIYGIPV